MGVSHSIGLSLLLPCSYTRLVSNPVPALAQLPALFLLCSEPAVDSRADAWLWFLAWLLPHWLLDPTTTTPTTRSDSPHLRFWHYTLSWSEAYASSVTGQFCWLLSSWAALGAKHLRNIGTAKLAPPSFLLPTPWVQSWVRELAMIWHYIII